MKHLTGMTKGTPAAALTGIVGKGPGPLGQNELGDTVIWLVNLIGQGRLLPAGLRKSATPPEA